MSKKTIPFVLYLISFIPYLLLLFASIFGVEFGFFGNFSTYYGWEAVILMALGLCFVPILPVAALYQVIFLLWTRKRLSPRQKKANRILILSIAGALFGSCILYHVLTEIRLEHLYQQDKAIIETYLEKEFGEEHAAEMEVKKPCEASLNYQVKSPVMASSFLVCMDESHHEVFACTFCEAYTRDFDLETRLSQKLAADYDVPDTTQLCVVIKSFPFREAFSPDRDRLLESCEFELVSVYLDTDRYDREETLEEIRRFYTGYGRELLKYRKDSSLNFYVRGKEDFYASIQAILSREDPNVCHLYFSGYTNSEGVTSIPHEETDLLLER